MIDEPNYRDPYPSGPAGYDYRDSRDPSYPPRYEDNELRERDRRRGSYDYYPPYEDPGYDAPPDYRAPPASKPGPIPIARGYTTGSIDLYDYDNYGPGGGGYNDRNYDYPVDYPSDSYSRDAYDGPRYDRSSSAVPYDYAPDRNISRNASLSRDPLASGGGRDFSPERRDLPPRDVPPRDLAPRDLSLRDLPPRDLPPRDIPARDVPPRDLPPRDLPPRDPGYTRESGIPTLRPPREPAPVLSVPVPGGSSRDIIAPIREKSPSVASSTSSSLPKPSKIPPPKTSSDRPPSDRPPASSLVPPPSSNASNSAAAPSNRLPINPPISSPTGPIPMKRSISNDEYVPPQKKPFVRPPPAKPPLTSGIPSGIPTPSATPKSLVPPPPIPPNVARPKASMASSIPTPTASHGSLKEGSTRPSYSSLPTSSNPASAPDRSPAGSSVTSTNTPTTNASAPSTVPVQAQQPKPLLKLGSDEITKPKEIIPSGGSKPSNLPVGSTSATANSTSSTSGPTEITRPKLFDRKDSFSASNTSNIPRPLLTSVKPAPLSIPTPSNKEATNPLTSHHHPAHHTPATETAIVYTLPTSQLDVKSESSSNNYAGMFKNPAFFPPATTPSVGNENNGPSGMFDNLIQRSLSAMSSDDTNVQPTQPQRRPRAAWGKGLIVQPPPVPVKVEEPPTPAPSEEPVKVQEERKPEEKMDVAVKEEQTTTSDVPPALSMVSTLSMEVVDDDQDGQLNKSSTKRPGKRSRSQLQDAGDAPSSPIPTLPKGIKEPLSTIKEENPAVDEANEPNRKKRGRPFNTKRQVSSDDESTSNQATANVVPEGLRSPKAIKEEDHAIVVGSPHASQESRTKKDKERDRERERELLQREKDRERDRERERARERERERERERVERERDRERERIEREKEKDRGENKDKGDETTSSGPRPGTTSNDRRASAGGANEAGRGSAGAGRGRGRGGGRWANRHLQQQQQQERSAEHDDATTTARTKKGGDSSDDYPNAPNRAIRDTSTTSSAIVSQQQKKLSQKEKKQMLLERIQLGNVFTKEVDLLRTYNTMAYILELQKTQVDPNNHKAVTQFTNICNIFQDIKTVQAATKLSLLKSSEICYAIDLIESNIEMFYTMLGNQRAKQYMTESKCSISSISLI